MSEDDETLITEITFLPDGRLCIFGASQQVLALLGELDLGDADLQKRCAHLQALNSPPSGPHSTLQSAARNSEIKRDE